MSSLRAVCASIQSPLLNSTCKLEHFEYYTGRLLSKSNAAFGQFGHHWTRRQIIGCSRGDHVVHTTCPLDVSERIKVPSPPTAFSSPFLHANTMRQFLFCLLLCLTTFTQNALASVLAIDYGSEWIKASLMSPGVPFDVLLDRNSKRKIQSTVGWKKDDRLFGSDAFNIVSSPTRPKRMFLTKRRQGGFLQTLSRI